MQSNMRHDAVKCAWHDVVKYANTQSVTCGTWLIQMFNTTQWNAIWNQSHVRHDPVTCVTWRSHMCDMMHSNVWHDAVTSVTRPIHVQHDSVTCATWLNQMCVTWRSRFWKHIRVSQMCDMTHSNVQYDSLECDMKSVKRATLLATCTYIYIHIDTYVYIYIRMYVRCVTHSNVRHDSFKCAPWLIQMCAMTHSNTHQDSIKCATWLIHICDMTQMCDMIPSNVRHDSVPCVKGLSHVCAMTQ